MNCPLEETTSPHPATLAISLSSRSGDGRWILPSLIKGSIAEAGFIGRENREESGKHKSGKQKHPREAKAFQPRRSIRARQEQLQWNGAADLKERVSGVTRSCSFLLEEQTERRVVPRESPYVLRGAQQHRQTAAVASWWPLSDSVAELTPDSKSQQRQTLIETV